MKRKPTKRPSKARTAEAVAPTTPLAQGRTQDELRDRRRHWLRVHYTPDFDLAAEVAAIVDPLARAVGQLPRPEVVHGEINDVADAVHALTSTVVGMLAETGRNLDGPTRARTAQALADLAERPKEPQVHKRMLTSGSWAAVLVGHVAPYAGDLSALLGRAMPPGHPGLQGGLSLSERLEKELRELDSAALTLARLVPRVAARQNLPTIEQFNATKRAQRDDARRRAARAKMGVTE